MGNRGRTMMKFVVIAAIICGVSATLSHEQLDEIAFNARHSETFESSFLEVMSDEKGARCPVGRVGCPMCYDIVDRFNSDVEIPEHSEAFEHFCDGYINKRWKASYEMLTGGQLDPMKEKIRCVSVSAGVKERFQQGCPHGNCAAPSASLGLLLRSEEEEDRGRDTSQNMNNRVFVSPSLRLSQACVMEEEGKTIKFPSFICECIKRRDN